MVKHSVLLVVPNVAAISSFRWVPRTAICRGRAASGLSIAVRLAGPRADAACRGPGLGPGPAHLPGSGAVERRPNRGDSPVAALRFVAAGSTRPVLDGASVPVLRRHAGSFALVRRAPSLRQRWRIHRPGTLLFFPSHDCERGRSAEFG